jgi:hypothetical protein
LAACSGLRSPPHELKTIRPLRCEAPFNDICRLVTRQSLRRGGGRTHASHLWL